jgi:hypothetical protein
MKVRMTEHGQYEVQIDDGQWWPAMLENAEQRLAEPPSESSRTWIQAFIDAMTPAERAKYDRVVAERRSPEPVYRFCPECGQPLDRDR